MKRPDFDLDNYLNYTEMIGEPATRYTWQSVLMFDIEDNYLNYTEMIRELATRYTWQSVLMFDIEDNYLNYTEMIRELATRYTWQSVLMFDTEDSYLNYTKMIGELATRYTWQSVLMFDIEDSYLNHTEMIGEVATRYTWQSVLMFDTEYRQRQAAHKSAWGDQAPHLCDHPLPSTPLQRQASSSRQRQQPTGPSGKEVCLQYNRGSCSYVSQCVFDHMCASCRKNRPCHDHIAATPSNNSSA